MDKDPASKTQEPGSEDKILRILILNWRDPAHPLAGGAEYSMYEHALYWRKKGAHVTWVGSAFEGAKKNETKKGIKFLRMGSHFTVHLKTFFRYMRGEFRDADIVIDCFHFVPYFTPLYVRNKSIVAWINEPAKNAWFKNIFFPASLIGFIFEPLFFVPYRKAQFVTSAKSIKKELIKLGVRRIKVIPHGIEILDMDRIKKEQSLTLIYLAQITEDKGIENALRAFSIISHKSEIINPVLWVVGKAPDSKYLKKVKKLVRDLKLVKNVKFFGYVDKRQKFTLLKKAWILVHPSVREGWGLNVIEAAGVGTPSVGYDVVGLRDSIKNGKTGLLSEENPEDMAEKCMKLVRDRDFYDKLSVNAKEHANSFSWQKAGKKSLQIIKSL